MEGGFDIRSRKSVLKGGDNFESELLFPGDSAKGHLLAIVSRQEDGFEMPPKEADQLTQEEVWAIRDWIDGGAPWPDAARVEQIYKSYAKGIVWKTSGGLSKAWTNRKYKPEDLWAYQPLWKDAENLVQKSKQNPIDYFIDAKLKEKGVEPAKPASRLELIRRATFDLIGLPPTPAQIDRFLNDRQPDDKAFSDLVDRYVPWPVCLYLDSNRGLQQQVCSHRSN